MPSNHYFMALLETMSVEAAKNPEHRKTMEPSVDVIVAGQHVARAHYEERNDTLIVDTLKGEFCF